MTLEKYLQGVVRGEMPASFEMEALKRPGGGGADVCVLSAGGGTEGAPPGGGRCTDHTCCSAFLSEQAAREKWGGDYDPWEARSSRRWRRRTGRRCCTAASPYWRCSTSSSAGKTAAAGQVWSGDLPYLQSVDSPESEETVPNYYSVVTFTAAEAKEKLLAARPGLKLEGHAGGLVGGVTEDASGRVETAVIGGETWKGTEVRAASGCGPACFAAEAQAESLTFYVTGYGHGVGMSQYGANQLAREGKTWRRY